MYFYLYIILNNQNHDFSAFKFIYYFTKSIDNHKSIHKSSYEKKYLNNF